MEYRKKKKKRLPGWAKFLLILLEIVLSIVFIVYGVLCAHLWGPSETAKKMVTKTLQESSALKWVPRLCLSQEKIDSFYQNDVGELTVSMDTSLIDISREAVKSEDGTDEWGLVDDDNDGIALAPVHGSTYNGYIMAIYDPSRVIMGCVPESFNVRGYTVEEMVKEFDAVAGINGGGFVDINGSGNGETPDSCAVFRGEKYFAYSSELIGFAGLDSNHILHVDCTNVEDIEKYDIRYGCGYGPVLVVNGEINIGESWESGLNPRTAIGQREDGTILFLVIDGRSVASLGASFQDLAEVMVRYGAVNAMNMDGGSSALMYMEDHYVNNEAFVIGIRPVPTTWLVLKDGAQDAYY